MKKSFLSLIILVLATLTQQLYAQCSFTVNGLNAPFLLCSGNLPATLESSPPGGTFSGPGVIGNTFNPISTLLPGNFPITLTVNGCVVTQTIFVDVPNQQASIDNGFGPLFCQNDAPITLTGNVGASGVFTINNNVLPSNVFDPSTFPVNTPLDIVYTYFSPNGCNSTDQTTFTVFPMPQIDASVVPAQICENANPISLTTTNGTATFDYSGTGVSISNIFDPAAAGVGTHNISVTATQLGCSTTQSLPITVNAALQANFESTGNKCLSELDTLYYIGAPLSNATFDWQLPADANLIYNGGDSIVVNFGSAGDKTVTLNISNTDACVPASISRTFEKELVGVSTIENTTHTLNQPIELTTNAVSSYGYELTLAWQPAESLSCNNCLSPVAAPNQTTTYHITATSPNGCIATDSVIIAIIEQQNVFIPNIFTPNGDLQNDQFLIYGNQIATMDMQIFDRWGAQIFRTNNLSEGWDGSFQNSKVNLGAYLYLINVEMKDGSQQIYKGSVTVAR